MQKELRVHPGWKQKWIPAAAPRRSFVLDRSHFLFHMKLVVFIIYTHWQGGRMEPGPLSIHGFFLLLKKLFAHFLCSPFSPVASSGSTSRGDSELLLRWVGGVSPFPTMIKTSNKIVLDFGWLSVCLFPGHIWDKCCCTMCNPGNPYASGDKRIFEITVKLLSCEAQRTTEADIRAASTVKQRLDEMPSLEGKIPTLCQEVISAFLHGDMTAHMNQWKLFGILSKQFFKTEM